MTKEKLGSEPAFPFRQKYSSGFENHLGISKRFYAACAAMQGILANPNASPSNEEHFRNIIEDAFKSADELLRREEL